MADGEDCLIELEDDDEQESVETEDPNEIAVRHLVFPLRTLALYLLFFIFHFDSYVSSFTVS